MKISVLLSVAAASFVFVGQANANFNANWNLNELNRCHQNAVSAQDHEKCTAVHKCVNSGKSLNDCVAESVDQSVKVDSTFSDRSLVGTNVESSNYGEARSERKLDLSDPTGWDKARKGEYKSE